MENKSDLVENIIGSRLKLRKDNIYGMLKDINKDIRDKNKTLVQSNSNMITEKYSNNSVLEQDDIIKSIDYILQLESLEDDEELYVKFSCDLKNYFKYVYDKVTIKKYLNVNFHLKKEVELNTKFSLLIKTNNKILSLSPIIFENIISCIILNINIKNGIYDKVTKDPKNYFLIGFTLAYYWNTILDLLNSDNISCLLTLYLDSFSNLGINLSYKIIVMLFNCSFIELRNSFFTKDFNELKWLHQLTYLPSVFKPIFQDQDFEKELMENQNNDRTIANEFIDLLVKVINISNNDNNKLLHYICYYDSFNENLDTEFIRKWRKNKEDQLVSELPRDMFEIIIMNLIKTPKEIDINIIFVIIQKSNLEVLLFLINCDISFYLCKMLQESISKHFTYVILQCLSNIFYRLKIENSLIYQDFKDAFISYGYREIIESLSNDYSENCSTLANQIYKTNFV